MPVAVFPAPPPPPPAPGGPAQPAFQAGAFQESPAFQADKGGTPNDGKGFQVGICRQGGRAHFFVVWPRFPHDCRTGRSRW